MCGITGFVDWAATSPTVAIVVQAMTATLRPRGPDASSVWTSDQVALGHTRLAIIDVAGGQQPMTTADYGGTLALSYGGEVYNFRELRHQLTGLGHRFTTTSDTEVVLRAYAQWGPDCVRRLDGMFAFALWDGRTSNLVLARDRLGIKPLYYAPTSTGVAFGSELKALLAHPDITATVDADGLAELVSLVPMLSPGHAVLRGVHELEPAHIAIVDSERTRLHRYWRLADHRHTDDLPTTVARVRELLTASVRSHLVADVPVSVLNSGGVDSSAVAALAAREITGLRTFDIDLASEPGDISHSASGLHVGRDNAYALLTAKHVGSQHHTHTVTTQDLLDAHEATVAAMDLPSLSTLNTSLGLLFHRVSQDTPVTLSGEGADELFHGYRWYHSSDDYDRPGFPWHTIYRPIHHLLTPEANAHIKPTRYLRERYLSALPAGNDELRHAAALTNTFYLPFLLRRADRLAMAAGVEVRVPFLDHRLVEYTWNIPPAMKGVDGIEKAVLRRAVEDLLPPEIAWRRKSGYPASITASYQRALWQQAKDVLTDSAAPIRQFIDASATLTYLEHNLGNLSDWTPTQHISYLLELNTWLQSYRVHLR